MNFNAVKMEGRFRNIWIIAAFWIMTVSCSTEPVKVYRDNPHYFYYKDKPLVLITTDHHYGAIIDLDFDYAGFLEYLAGSGMNLTRIYPGGMFEPTDKYIAGNPLGPRQGRQLLPWVRSDESGANPLLAEAGQTSFKYDLNKWNPEYFARLRAFTELARKKDIIVEVAFFNGMYADCWPLMAMYHENNIQDIGNYEAADCGLFTSAENPNQEVMEYQKAYIKKITTELNGFDNVIFDICDEPSLQGLPVGGIRVNPDSVVAPWIIEMKDAFLEAERSLPKKHLLGQTIKNLSPDLSDESWCEWLPTEYVKPAEKALRQNYKNNKPLVNVETNYFGISLTKDSYDVDAVRAEGWWYMLGGGAGCINLNGEYYRGNETGGTKTQTLIAPQMKVLKDFMMSLDLKGISRYNGISCPASDAICHSLAVPGKQYALYLFHGSYDSEWGASFLTRTGSYKDTLTFNSVPQGNYTAEWIDPASGSVTHSEDAVSNGNDLVLITPSFSMDIALKLIKHN
jgi:hypothetical protein